MGEVWRSGKRLASVNAEVRTFKRRDTYLPPSPTPRSVERRSHRIPGAWRLIRDVRGI